MRTREPTEAELERAQEAWRSLQGLTSQRAIWELSLLLTQREGRAFEHGVIEGRRYPDGQALNPYNGELTRPRGAPSLTINPDGAYGQEMGLPRSGR